MIPLLNVDLGELPNEAEELYALAQLASVACGGHAGDAASMARALEICRRLGARPGAHPSYPDREGFGRRTLRMAPSDLAAAVQVQCESLRDLGTAIGHVKPHGALYHDADREKPIARAVIEGAVAALGSGIAVIGPGGGALQATARTAGLRFLREAFADRGVDAAGRLLPRGEPGALITDPVAAAARARELVDRCDTLCLHGDTPGAVVIARAVRAALDAAGSP
jgi:UPF0271 protein